MWNVDPLQMIMFLDYHFDNTKALDKATFEHELLKIRLSDYIVTPTKVIPFTHKAVKEWNRLTLDRDVTIVSGKPNVERYLFGCILQNITDLNIDKWNSFVENEGKLNSDVKRQLLAQTNFVVETLKDLLILLWAKKKIPLILKTDAWLPVLREFSHLKRKYIIIDSNVKKRFAEIKNYGLTVFSHLGDIETETLMKNIPVSLQGREPTSLYEIINGDKALKEAVSCFDVMNLTRPRAPCVNRECLDETENPQCHNHEQQHGEQLVRSNIVIPLPTDYYCYLRFENRESSTDDERLTAISTKNEHCTIEKDEGRCGLNCFLVDQNGDVIPIIGQVPIYRHYRPAYRQLRKGSITVKQSSISINKYASNKFSISYSKHLITARALFEKAINEITVVAGEPEMGKTTLLQSLFLLCESKYYVIFIDLAQHRDNFCNDKLKSFQDFIRLSCNECLSLPYSDFLQKLHDYPERLVVMLDSFDERLATYEKQKNCVPFAVNHLSSQFPTSSKLLKRSSASASPIDAKRCLLFKTSANWWHWPSTRPGYCDQSKDEIERCDPVILREKARWTTLNAEILRRGIRTRNVVNTNVGIRIQPATPADCRQLVQAPSYVESQITSPRMKSARIWHEKESASCCAKGRLWGSPTPPVVIQLTKNDQLKQIFRITPVCGINVTVESKPVKKDQVTQYHRCQLYGHWHGHPATVCIKDACRTTPDRRVYEPRDASAKCALYQDPHTAKYKRCQKSPYTKNGKFWSNCPRLLRSRLILRKRPPNRWTPSTPSGPKPSPKKPVESQPSTKPSPAIVEEVADYDASETSSCPKTDVMSILSKLLSLIQKINWSKLFGVATSLLPKLLKCRSLPTSS
ncbi:hypothetical protein Trydic_g22032 [Trypoxylus dichotomus]